MHTYTFCEGVNASGCLQLVCEQTHPDVQCWMCQNPVATLKPERLQASITTGSIAFGIFTRANCTIHSLTFSLKSSCNRWRYLTIQQSTYAATIRSTGRQVQPLACVDGKHRVDCNARPPSVVNVFNCVKQSLHGGTCLCALACTMECMWTKDGRNCMTMQQHVSACKEIGTSADSKHV